MTLLLAGWLFLLTLSLGSFLLRKWGFSFQGLLERSGFALCLGYGLIGYFVLIIGLFGFLNLQVAAISLGCLTLLLVREELFWLKWLLSLPRRLFALRKEDPKAFYFALAGFGVLILALLQALLPPTAHDAMCYHLYIPKRFVAVQRIEYLPYLVNSLFPFLIEMHFTLALLFGQPALANIFHLFTGVGLFLGIAAFGRRLGSLWVGLAAGLIFILTPGIFNQMVITYNDVGLAFFSFFAVYAFLKLSEENGARKWFVLMGIFSGFALSVKYLALFHIAAILILCPLTLILSPWGGEGRVRGARNLFRGFPIYLIFTFLFSFIWYLRSYLHEGNPVYPFFPEIFGGTGKEYDFERAGAGKGILNFILVFWRMTMSPQQFGGTWAQLGLCYLTFLPLLFKKGRWPQMLIRFSLLYFLFWFFTVQNLRFLFPLLPVLSVLIALAAQRQWVWLAVLLMLNAGFAVYHGESGYAYLLGRESSAGYLGREERTHSLAQWMNQNIPKNAKVLNVEEVRMFYFDPEMIREREFRKKTRYPETFKTPEEVLELFKTVGITHILFVLHEETDPESLPPLAIRSLIQNEDFKNSYLQLLHEQTAGNEKYEVYQIRYPTE